MASAQCSQCGKVEDSRTLSVCPVCREYYCSSCIPRHQMQCGCSVQGTMITNPI